jgi:hypothetical protein
MEIFQNFENSLDKIWQPVLKPPRTPVSNDILGFRYLYTLNDNIYRRQDGTFKTFDNLTLRFTCYLKLKKNDILDSREFISNRNSYPKKNLKELLEETETNSIEGKSQIMLNIRNK